MARIGLLGISLSLLIIPTSEQYENQNIKTLKTIKIKHSFISCWVYMFNADACIGRMEYDLSPSNDPLS